MTSAPRRFETDILTTSGGKLAITSFGHGSVGFTYNNQVIYVDPYGRVADYAALPKADLILVTHEHQDHLDPKAIAAARMKDTAIVISASCAPQLAGGIVMRNGDARTVQGIPIEAVPAYNILHQRDNGLPFHPKGVGNGYVLTFGDARVYLAGDTENVPEMKNLRDITCAFLPMNLPYTMTPEMAAAAAKTIRPALLYPYHYGDTDPARLTALLADQPEIEVRIRQLR